MFEWVSGAWSYSFALLLSASAGVVAEKFLNISGRLVQPLWYKTFGRIHRQRRLRRETRLLGSGETFAVGAAKHEIYVRQFAVDGFRPEHLFSATLPAQSAGGLVDRLPTRLQPGGAADLERMIEDKRRELDAAPGAWNAEMLALRRLEVSRVGSHELPALKLHYAKTDYASFQVISSEWEKRFAEGLAGGEILGEELLDVLPGLSHSFGINLTIETADDHLLLTRRSAKTSGGRNLRHISVNEGMALMDLDPKTGLPDPYRTALRGISEELGIDLENEPDIRNRITFHGLICDVTRYEWALLGHVNLTQTGWTNASFIAARRLGMGPDDWESNGLEFIPMTKAAVEEALRDDAEWVGHGYMNLVLSAMHRLRSDHRAILAAVRSALV
ncbi:hypothetical protein LJ756_09850 [Arthrobacter sp. zg-Y411]|uniref:hypothetical protein n=1 Tax=Arthrobacter zhangbolii TaxID=2886936 RepID=UPI001D140074|nr:hypothetical protein [Arthrobacter zhangbolii]MCC3294926.1 hypothetical protein [Arthrobacter zhangbolii]